MKGTELKNLIFLFLHARMNSYREAKSDTDRMIGSRVSAWPEPPVAWQHTAERVISKEKPINERENTTQSTCRPGFTGTGTGGAHSQPMHVT